MFEDFHSTIGLIRKHLKHLSGFIGPTETIGTGLMLSCILTIRNFLIYILDLAFFKSF